MPKVIYISHPVTEDVDRNIEKILSILKVIHTQSKGEIIPIAPYIVALQYLDDSVTEERELGILANEEHFVRKIMEETWFYGNKIGKGGEKEIKLSLKYKIPIVCKNQTIKPRLEEVIAINSGN
ncbi:TPA: hypothetical protein HA219_01440 [Candidatus Woesearchaeota archaeon]|nr:hypothetical protein [Candidatus Woesearchaeota archaeon]